MKKNFYYGGQAVIEGVMMRGESDLSVAVRAPSGKIVVHTEPLPAAIYRAHWAKWPFLRGLVILWDALGLGTKALFYSADVAMGEEETSFSKPATWTTLAISFTLAIGVFFWIPSAAAQLLEHFWPSVWASAIIEGAIRLLMFVGYLVAVGMTSDIHRVFMYHGAEHKTINAYEAGAPLIPEEVKKYTRVHVRCGTSFILFVLLISIIVFAPLHYPQLWLRLLSRLLLIPVVSSLAYELIRLSANHPDNKPLRWLITPGLWMHGLTTREPTLEMLEVGIASLKPVLLADGQSWQESKQSEATQQVVLPGAVSPA